MFTWNMKIKTLSAWKSLEELPLKTLFESRFLPWIPVEYHPNNKFHKNLKVIFKCWTQQKRKRKSFEFETDQEPIENGVSISFRIPSGVVPKNTESLNVKIFSASPQSINNFDAQRKGITIPFFLPFWSSFMAGLLHQKFNTFNYYSASELVTRALENQTQSWGSWARL